MSFSIALDTGTTLFKTNKRGGCSTGASDSPAPPEIGYRDFGVTSSFVVEASGFDELPDQAAHFFHVFRVMLFASGHVFPRSHWYARRIILLKLAPGFEVVP